MGDLGRQERPWQVVLAAAPSATKNLRLLASWLARIGFLADPSSLLRKLFSRQRGPQLDFFAGINVQLSMVPPLQLAADRTTPPNL
jgi:hypothetical protein